MATSSTHSIGPSLNPKIPYNAQADFTPVAHVADSVNVLLIAPNVKASNVGELISLLKSQPAQFNFGSSGNGTIVHLTGELFKSMTGTYAVHIPYRGTALVIPDMVSGQIHLLFDNIASAMPHIKDGKLRAIAVTSLKRSPLLPTLPPVADTVPGFESIVWFGVFGPRGMPAEATQRLNAEINAVLKVTRVPGAAARAGLRRCRRNAGRLRESRRRRHRQVGEADQGPPDHCGVEHAAHMAAD